MSVSRFFLAGEDFFISSHFLRIKIESRKRYQAAFFMILLFDFLFAVARIVGQVFFADEQRTPALKIRQDKITRVSKLFHSYHVSTNFVFMQSNRHQSYA